MRLKYFTLYIRSTTQTTTTWRHQTCICILMTSQGVPFIHHVILKTKQIIHHWPEGLMQSVNQWMMWNCHTQFYTLLTFMLLLANPSSTTLHFHNITSTCVAAHSTSSFGTASPASTPCCVTESTKTITLHHQNTVTEEHSVTFYPYFSPTNEFPPTFAEWDLKWFSPTV